MVRNQRWTVMMAYGAVILVILSVYTMPSDGLGIGPFTASLDWNASAVNSIAFLAIFAALYPSVWACKAYGPVAVSIGGLLLVAAGCIGSIAGGSVIVLVSSVAAALGLGVCSVALPGLLMQTNPQDCRSEVLGCTAAAAFTGYLCAAGLHYFCAVSLQQIEAVSGLLLLTVVVYLYHQCPVFARPHVVAAMLGKSLHQLRNTVLLSVICLLLLAGNCGCLICFTGFMVSLSDISQDSAVLYLWLGLWGGILGSVGMGWILAKTVYRQCLLVSCTVFSFVFSILGFLLPTGAVPVLLFCIWFGIGGSITLLYSMVLAQVDLVYAGLALLAGMQMLAYVLASIVAGLCVAGEHWLIAALICTVTIVAALILAMVLYEMAAGSALFINLEEKKSIKNKLS